MAEAGLRDGRSQLTGARLWTFQLFENQRPRLGITAAPVWNCRVQKRCAQPIHDPSITFWLANRLLRGRGKPFLRAPGIRRIDIVQ
jgi:hypothetical protein